MRIEELRSKNKDELQAELISLLQEQFNLRMQKGSGTPPKSHLYKQVRRNIARVKTLIREQEGEK